MFAHGKKKKEKEKEAFDKITNENTMSCNFIIRDLIAKQYFPQQRSRKNIIFQVITNLYFNLIEIKSANPTALIYVYTYMKFDAYLFYRYDIKINEQIARALLFLIYDLNVTLTPSSLPCNKWKAPALWIPGRNQIGWDRMSLSIKMMSHATSLPESSVDPEDPPEVADPADDNDSSLY